MHKTLITAPTFLPVGLDEIADFLRIEQTEDSALLRSFLDFAIEKAETITGRRLAQQQWRFDLESFESEVFLPYPPLITVDSVNYYDSLNVFKTLPSDEYEVNGVGNLGKIRPAYGYYFPGTYYRYDAVQVTFTCGYATQDLIPEGIKNGIKSIVWHMYDDRGQKITDEFFRFLFAPFMLRGFV